MLKETSRDVLKVFDEGLTYYTDADILTIYDDIRNHQHWTIKKVSHIPSPLRCREMMLMLDDGAEFDSYSTGGGFWLAELTYQGKVFTVENEFPLCLNIFNKVDDKDEQFMDENMVDSYDVNSRELSPITRNIYEFLIELLSD